MDKPVELRRQLGALIDELDTDAMIADEKAFAAKEAEIAAKKAEIARAERAQAASAATARPVGAAAEPGAREFRSVDESGGLLNFRRRMGESLNPRAPDAMADYVSAARKGLGYGFDASKQFRTFGEQLQAIAMHYSSKGANTDGRLVRAPSGASEGAPTDGGFLVGVDFAAAIFMLMHDMGNILSRTRKIPISANANGIKIPGVDETSRADGSRWGGVSSTWVGDGTTVSPTRPKFRLVELDLKKLLSLFYATDEMLADAENLASIAMQAFSEELMFKTEDALFNGSGAGMPLGFMKSPALVTIAKETGQATKTIVKENLDKMFARCWGPSRANAVWLMNQDVEPQLQTLNGQVGSAGDLVYMPPGGLSQAPYATLKGRPIINVEYAQTLGTTGDIVLVDCSQIAVADKNGIQAASSMHVAFNTDEQVFRFTYRVDGKPLWAAPLTPKNGSNTFSPFIALATR